MKTMKNYMIALLGLLALASCSNDDDEVTGPATEKQMQEISGHWYAELPISGETENWRTEEEGDMTTFDKVGVLIYLNGYYPDACYWGYIYLQDGDMVNFDGLHRRDEAANFEITMDREGNITTSSHLPDAPQVSNMHYANSLITADVAYHGYTFNITFRHVETKEEQTLKEFYSILQEEGIIGGFADDGDNMKTEVTGDDATEPQRARQF